MSIGNFFEELTKIVSSLYPHNLLVSFDCDEKINVKFRQQYSSWAIWWDGIRFNDIEEHGERFILDLKKRINGERGEKFFKRERY